MRKFCLSVKRFFTGHDIFIAYSRLDGAAYASSLADRLSASENDFHCYFDQWEAPPRRELPPGLLRALEGSRMLVVVGSSGAAGSGAVLKELQHFRPRSGVLIPISFGNALEDARWFPLIEGLAVEREPAEALRSGIPSESVLRRILSTYSYSRRNQRVRRFLWSATAVVAGLLLVSAATTKNALDRREESIARQMVLDANQIRSEQGARLETSVLLALEARRRLEKVGADGLAATVALHEGLSILPRLLSQARLPAAPKHLWFLPDGAHVLSSDGYVVHLWDLKNGQVQRVGPTFGSINAATEDGTHVLGRDRNGLALWRFPEATRHAWPAAPSFYAAAISRDGKVAALTANDSTVHIWRPDSPERTEPLDLQGLDAKRISLSDDGSVVAVSGSKAGIGRTWLFWIKTGEARYFEHGSDVRKMVLTGDGKHVALASRAFGRIQRPWNIEIWNTEEVAAAPAGRNALPLTSITTGELASFDLQRGQDRLVLVLRDGSAQLLEFTGAATPIGDRRHGTAAAQFVGNHVLTLNRDGTARMFPSEGGPERLRFFHRAPLVAVAYPQGSAPVATASADGMVKVWSTANALKAGTVRMGDPQMTPLREWVFSADQRTMATQTLSQAATWNPADGKLLKRMSGLEGRVIRAGLSGDGRLLVLGAIEPYGPGGSLLQVFEAAKGTPLHPHLSTRGVVTDVAVSNQQAVFRVTHGLDHVPAIGSWDLAANKLSWVSGGEQPWMGDVEGGRPELEKLERAWLNQSPVSAAISEDAEFAAVTTRDRRLELISARTGVRTSVLLPGKDEVAAVGRRGDVLVLLPESEKGPFTSYRPPHKAGTAHILDARLRTVARFEVARGEHIRLVSPDGRLIVSKPNANSLRLIDAGCGADRMRIESINEIAGAAFSADSRYLVVSGHDRAARVFDLHVDREIAQVFHPAPLIDAGFNSTSTRLLTRQLNDNIIRIWKWRPDEIAGAACEYLTRNLEDAECARYGPGRCLPACGSLKTPAVVTPPVPPK